MENPISRLVPQLFGDYPKNFERLYSAILINKKKSNDTIKVELWKAYEFGQNKHSGQKRKSGEPYFNHCMAVAKTLAEWNMDITTIIQIIPIPVMFMKVIRMNQILKPMNKRGLY